MSTFPNHFPSDRRYSHGTWPITRHRFMANTEQRMLHATAKTKQELRLTFANRPTEIVQEYLDHFESTYGTQFAFAIPAGVFAGWTRGQILLGQNLLWQYKEPPRVSSPRGMVATLQITLITATTGGQLLEVGGVRTGLPAGLQPGSILPSSSSPSSDPVFANVAQTSGWTYGRFRINPNEESINSMWEINHHINGGMSTTGWIQNNPDNWIVFAEPTGLRNTTVNGITYYWYEDIYTLKFNPNYTWMGPHSGYGTGMLYEPRFDGSEPETEFYTGHYSFTILSENANIRAWVRAYRQRLHRTNPPWEAAPYVPSINYYGANDGFFDVSAATPASANVPGLEGSMYHPGWEYQVWVPDRTQTEPIIGGPVRPYITEGSTRTRWRNDGEGGRWLNVNENWNRGVYGGGIETAPWLLNTPGGT